MVNEDEGLMLPPALRLAANSSRGRMQKKYDDRMTLKNEAKAMRLRLAQMDDQPTGFPAAISLNDTPRSRSIPRSSGYAVNPRSRSAPRTRGLERKNSGKYSIDVLKKKIKKAAKMLDKSTPGSKEYETLEKKLNGYRAQLEEQDEHQNGRISPSSSSSSQYSEEKVRTERREQFSTNNSTGSEEITDDEQSVDSLKVYKASKDGDKKKYSIDTLKKKLKKVEKKLHECTSGSKEHNKLQKKQTEYESQIIEQDKMIHEEKAKILQRAELRAQARILRRKNLGKQQKEKDAKEAEKDAVEAAEAAERAEKQRKEKEAKEAAEKAEKQRKIEKAWQEEQAAKYSKQREEEEKLRMKQARRLEEIAAKRKVEDSESKTSQSKSYLQCDDEDKKKKRQAYLEEARRLTQEKKRNKEGSKKKTEEAKESYLVRKLSKKKIYEDDEKVKEFSLVRNLSREKIHEADEKSKESSLVRKSSKKKIYENFENGKEPPSLLRKSSKKKIYETDENVKEPSLVRKSSKKKIHKVDENVNAPSLVRKSSREKIDASNSEEYKAPKINSIYGYDAQARKQAFLEEARKLKRDAMEKKLKQKEHTNEAKPLDVGYTKKKESPEREPNFSGEIRLTRDTQKEDQKLASAASSEPSTYREKSNFREDIRSKAEIPTKYEGRSDPIVSYEQNARSRNHKFLSDIRSKAKTQIPEVEQSDSTTSSEPVKRTVKPDLLSEIRSKAEKPKENALTQNSSSNIHNRRPKPSFLDEIRMKSETKKEEKPRMESYAFPEPTVHREKPDFLQEIKMKAREPKGKATDSSLKQNMRRPPKPDFLNEIKMKSQKSKGGTTDSSPKPNVQRPPKPDFLNEIKMKAQKSKGEATDSSPKHNLQRPPKPDFLQEIKMKTQKPKGRATDSSPKPNVQRPPKPDFLQEIKMKAQKPKVKASDSSPKPNMQRPPKLGFLQQLKMKVQKPKGGGTDSSPKPDIQRPPKPGFLNEIKMKAEKPKGGTAGSSPKPIMQRPPKPDFLSEIKMKAQNPKEGNADSNPKANMERPPKLDFLSEIKMKAEKPKGGTADSSPKTNMQRPPKPDFLNEIRMKAERKKEETPQNNDTYPSDSGEGGNSVDKNLPKSQPQNPKRTRNVTPTKDDALASPANQREEASKDYLDRRTLSKPFSNNTKKILRELENNEIRQKKLEKSLMQHGIAVTEDIPYEEAKDKITEITNSMKALATEDMDSYTMEKKYFHLEQELSKYTTALMLTDEYAEENRRLEQEWEDSVETENVAAIRALRSHMPVKIRHLTEDNLVSTPTPNGKSLPKAIARKFKRTNILQLLRVDPDDIEMMHPSLLEGMRTTGLTLTERRALHEHFRGVAQRWAEKKSDPSIEKKWQWFQMQKSKFKEVLTSYLRCVEQYGPPGDHKYAKRNDPKGSGCPLLGNQCPVKANLSVDYSDDYGYTQEAVYENSDGASKPKTPSSKERSVPKKKSSDANKISEAEMMEEVRDRLRLDIDETETDKKLLRELAHSEKKTKTLEKQLTHAGLSLPQEDISYAVAKTRVTELTEELNSLAQSMGATNDSKEIAKLEHAFGELSTEIDKYNNALMLTKEWAQEQKDKERQWEIDVSSANHEALKKVRRHMPVNIKNMSESTLVTAPTPNGNVLPKAMAKKFKRTNILMILRTEPSAIESMHPSSLEAMRTTGLTLTERRALHEHLKDVAPKWKAMSSDKMCERKWMWHASLQGKFKEMLGKYEKHVEAYGPPENHSCPMIGNQCPVRADLTTDYTGDYGYPENAEYEQQAVAKSNLLSMEELEKRRREDDYY